MEKENKENKCKPNIHAKYPWCLLNICSDHTKECKYFRKDFIFQSECIYFSTDNNINYCLNHEIKFK